MSLCFRELHDLVFDGRAVTRTSRSDRAPIHRRLRQVFLDHTPRGVARVRDPASELAGVARPLTDAPRARPEMRPRIVEQLDLTVLWLECARVYGTTIDARRSSSLESGNLEPYALQLLSEMR